MKGQSMTSALDIDDLLADPVLRGLAGDSRAAMAMSGKPTGYMSELESLKTALADSAARSDIECHAIRSPDGWYDLDSAEPRHADVLQDAVRYLTLRGLLEFHHAKSRWARIKAHPADAAEACQGLTCECMSAEGPES